MQRPGEKLGSPGLVLEAQQQLQSRRGSCERDGGYEADTDTLGSRVGRGAVRQFAARIERREQASPAPHPASRPGSRLTTPIPQFTTSTAYLPPNWQTDNKVETTKSMTMVQVNQLSQPGRPSQLSPVSFQPSKFVPGKFEESVKVEGEGPPPPRPPSAALSTSPAPVRWSPHCGTEQQPHYRPVRPVLPQTTTDF